ncbi:DUF485 domain-containing protein [Campylobacter sp.]|uniref:DUF485 domain-containing protein n=1 Tax=Campylobacter sp. TaxID=205 RepID=UPI0026DC9EA0|nr:DUF485 domain-containing protein [Campylobacter sp.]MDO4674738.1 DUF485 domain-containing protein [Campylobacter sp.]
MKPTQSQQKALKDFENFISKRNTISLSFSLVILIAYYAFILCVGLIPDVLGYRVGDTAISLGIVSGLGIIFLCVISTGIYVFIANSFFDSENSRLIEELEKNDLIDSLKEGKINYKDRQ